MNLLTSKDNENETALRIAAAAAGAGLHSPTGGSGDGQQKPASQLLEPDGERIDPGHTMNTLHDDVFPPRRRDTGSSGLTSDDDDDHYDDRDQQKKETTKHSHRHFNKSYITSYGDLMSAF